MECEDLIPPFSHYNPPCCQVLELDPDSAWAKAAVKRLEPLVAARHEKLKDEMLGKLKELGNSILGK